MFYCLPCFLEEGQINDLTWSRKWHPWSRLQRKRLLEYFYERTLLRKRWLLPRLLMCLPQEHLQNLLDKCSSSQLSLLHTSDSHDFYFEGRCRVCGDCIRWRTNEKNMLVQHLTQVANRVLFTSLILVITTFGYVQKVTLPLFLVTSLNEKETNEDKDTHG